MNNHSAWSFHVRNHTQLTFASETREWVGPVEVDHFSRQPLLFSFLLWTAYVAVSKQDKQLVLCREAGGDRNVALPLCNAEREYRCLFCGAVSVLICDVYTLIEFPVACVLCFRLRR